MRVVYTFLIDEPNVDFSNGDQIAIDEHRPAYLLAVKVQLVELLSFVDADADDVAFDIAVSYQLLIGVCSQTVYLVVMVLKDILVLDVAADDPPELDAAVPARRNKSLALRQEHQIAHRVVVGRYRLALASVDNVEQVNAVVPTTNRKDLVALDWNNRR